MNNYDQRLITGFAWKADFMEGYCVSDKLENVGSCAEHEAGMIMILINLYI